MLAPPPSASIGFIHNCGRVHKWSQAMRGDGPIVSSFRIEPWLLLATSFSEKSCQTPAFCGPFKLSPPGASGMGGNVQLSACTLCPTLLVSSSLPTPLFPHGPSRWVYEPWLLPRFRQVGALENCSVSFGVHFSHTPWFLKG